MDIQFGQIEDHRFALTITHKNFLACRIFDVSSGIIRYDNHKQTLEEYVNVLKKDEYRDLISGMISFILYLHERGKSLEMPKLSQSHNLVVNDGVIKYRLIRFKDATRETKKNDFCLIYNVLTGTDGLFENFQNRLPYDMEDLLTNMSPAGYLVENIALLAKHVAIMSPSLRICFCKNVSDRASYLSPSTVNQTAKYRQAVIRCGNFRSWIRDFKVKSKSFHIEECFYRRFPSKRQTTDREIEAAYRYSPNLFDSNASFLRCCRNMATHLPDTFGSVCSQLEEKDIELMLMQYFGEVVTKFQYALFKVGLLDLFLGCADRR